jgi:hypothetical protein
MSDTAFTVARKSCPGKEVMARRRIVEIGDWTQFTVTDCLSVSSCRGTPASDLVDPCPNLVPVDIVLASE